jgi:ferredoxin
MFQSLGRQIPATKGQTIFEAAEAAGVEFECDCHIGTCGIDPVKVLSGAEHMSPMSSTEKATLDDFCGGSEGQRLACVARVNGPIVVDIIKQ